MGQKYHTASMGTPDYLQTAAIDSFYTAGTNSQITNTYYDTVVAAGNGIQRVPQSAIAMRKRVSLTTYRATQADTVTAATYYSYDLDGNVNNLYQQIAGLSIKRIYYEYDLVSGKVNFVGYQNGKADQFYYQYLYDADNRITSALAGITADTTSYGFGSTLDPATKKTDASYQYYLHGPLARMELGDVNAQVQGVDYAYTLQGWLKGVNGTQYGLDSTQLVDMGGDGPNGVAKDAYSYNLYYYAGDYQPIGGTDPFDETLTTMKKGFYPLYNGNIAGMAETLPVINQPSVVNAYKYDQLNRIMLNQPYQNSLPSGLSEVQSMDEQFSYDGNGNIITSARHGDYWAAPKAMDNLTYEYNRDANGKLLNNRLNYIKDKVAFTPDANTHDLHNQTANNYTYDAIGNLTSDRQSNISAVTWSVYGKIQTITKTDGPDFTYSYYPGQERASQLWNGITTWYVRDAQGNTLAIYDNTHSHTNWKEQDLYGSSRLGMWTPNMDLANNNAAAIWDTIGHKQYELSNHLGNVLVTITDKRSPYVTGGDTVAYYPEPTTAQEYYAFGFAIPYRNYVLNNNYYRYGFNGKENDNEVKIDWSGNGIPGSQQDYGMRIYDPRVGRFLSVDPIFRQYPELSSYQFASDRPIDGVDQDGLEWNGAMFQASAENQKRGENPMAALHKAAATTFKDIGNLTYGVLAAVFAPFN
ncbi:MAG: RHS repeat-associated core domain-containing protein, partial [Candidatus Saccharimonadales bacterium]